MALNNDTELSSILSRLESLRNDELQNPPSLIALLDRPAVAQQGDSELSSSLVSHLDLLLRVSESGSIIADNMSALSTGQFNLPGEKRLYYQSPLPTNVWYVNFPYTLIPHQLDFSARLRPGDNNAYSYATDLIRAAVSALHEKLGVLSSVKYITSPSQVRIGANTAPEGLKLALFESRTTFAPFYLASRPNRLDTTAYNNSNEEVFCAALIFPVGPIGGMHIISAVFEIDPPDTLNSTEPRPGASSSNFGGLFPHRIDSHSRDCGGLHLVHEGYSPANGNIEYPVLGDFEYPSNDMLALHITPSDKFPVPGTFFGMKVVPRPTHVWFYQDSNPLLVSGNWFETEFYTSGIVENVIVPFSGQQGAGSADDVPHPQEELPLDQKVPTNLYDVRIKGRLFRIKPSDFFEYSVGDRVAILRRVGQDGIAFYGQPAPGGSQVNIPPRDVSPFGRKIVGNHCWADSDDIFALNPENVDSPQPLNGYIILPISFFER